MKECVLKAEEKKWRVYFNWMVKAANSLWEQIISSVSCLLLIFFNHISAHLRHIGKDA